MNGYQIELWADGKDYGMSEGSTLFNVTFDPEEALELVLKLKDEGHKNIGIVYASGWDANSIEEDAETVLKSWIDTGGYKVP